ncbi:polysaccharide biosynthesis/export family protein [Candidatus Zixiibacteriota bacterium]
MKRSLLVWTFVLTTGVIISACAGGADMATLLPYDQGADPSIGLLSEPEAGQSWQRPSNPESNAVFRTIGNAHYYRLNPEDEIELVFSLEDGPTPFPVRIESGGEVRLPTNISIDPITIGGLTVTEAEEHLAEVLSVTLRRPRPTLRITAYNGAHVTLMGEVISRGVSGTTGEGRYALERRTTLRDFILTHAAFGENADLSAIMITDASGRSGLFDLTAMIYRADESQNPVLDRGDRVFVPSTAVTQHQIFVLGEVTQQSMLQPQPGITVLDAIFQAGGPTAKARTRWVTLVRGRGIDADLYKIPYRDILKRGDMLANIRLEPGDIVYVGRSTYDSTISFFRDTWTILQTAVIATILVDSVKR